MMNKFIIFLFLLFIQCGDNVNSKGEVFFFEISIFNPLEYELPYFKVIFKNQKIYIQKSHNERDIEESNLSNKEIEHIIYLIKSFETLIIPSDLNKTGHNLITDKIKIRLNVKYKGEVFEKNEVEVLNCFEGYSNEFYEFYLMLRNLASLQTSNCDR